MNVHVNVVGGYRVGPEETGLDLPLLAAVASSVLDAPLPPRTLVVGEIGLGGEVRPPAAQGRGWTAAGVTTALCVCVCWPQPGRGAS